MNARLYSVAIKRSAEKEMDRFPAPIRERIWKVLLSLEHAPRPAGCKKLSLLDQYRMRVGKYRILYSVDDAHRLVTVVSVRHRREAYRRRR